MLYFSPLPLWLSDESSAKLIRHMQTVTRWLKSTGPWRPNYLPTLQSSDASKFYKDAVALQVFREEKSSLTRKPDNWLCMVEAPTPPPPSLLMSALYPVL